MIQYYDPIYELILFDLDFHGGPNIHPGAENSINGINFELPDSIIKTPELSRLIRINQASISYLAFPSATYNRFSHSLGCYMIADLAIRNIKVNANDNSAYIYNLLETDGLKREFYLSLLLHDIGHGPFSHELEHNIEISKILEKYIKNINWI